MKILIKILLWSLAFVPLIVDNKVFFPYTSGKNLLIESGLVLAGLLIIINFFISKSFKEEIIEKAVRYVKHPLVITVSTFVFINIISTIFAVDKYLAFWGELSRAEGLAGLVFFFAFFAFTLLIFEKKDWLWFFKLSLFTALILLGKEFWEFFHDGVYRPISFIGNPTFLAGYLLFSITSAWLVFTSNQGNSLAWKGVSLITIFFSIIGIFIAQTRGTILGLGLGFIAILIYYSFKGGDIFYKKLNLQKTCISFLCLGIIFSGVFVLTRKAEVWQKVPGLSRMAVMQVGDEDDPSTQIRLYVYKSALKSANPLNEGWKKTLIGWGPENFILADSKYYYPEQYKYEQKWYDRSHNKLLDVLVMTGLFGLLAYLAIWLFFFASLKRNRESGLNSLPLLFFSISYLTHLMFVFDQISTSIPFFTILAFTISLNSQNLTLSDSKKGQTLSSQDLNEKNEILIGTFLVILIIILNFIFFRNTMPGYVQMRKYTSLIKNQTKTFVSDIDSVFTPFTSAQYNIRRDFMDLANKKYTKESNTDNSFLLKKSINEGEDYLLDRPLDFGFMTTLSGLYSRAGNYLKNPEYLKRGEELFNKILTFAPNRPDMKQKLAVNLQYQGRYLEAFNLYEDSLKYLPSIIAEDRVEFEMVYTKSIKYFYEQKDKENFIKVANRLKVNNYKDIDLIDKILNYINKTGQWPRVDFN